MLKNFIKYSNKKYNKNIFKTINKMKKNETKKITQDHGLQWHSFDQVFKKASGKKEFKVSYSAESSRLRLAKQIRELRSLQRLSQKIVAQRAGMPQSVIARVESGSKGVTLDTLERIAYAFGKEVQLV